MLHLSSRKAEDSNQSGDRVAWLDLPMKKRKITSFVYYFAVFARPNLMAAQAIRWPEAGDAQLGLSSPTSPRPHDQALPAEAVRPLSTTGKTGKREHNLSKARHLR